MTTAIKFRYNRIAFALLLLVLLLGLLFIYVDYTHIISDDVPKSNEILLKQPSLTFKNRKFYLKGRPLQIFSGAIHYFRVHRKYWRDRLLLLKAAGFNTVDTCIPWNLHERSPGSFNFHGDFNIRKFCKIAQEIGLHVILKPGPFVGSQVDFGGLPAWLLQDPNMRVRSMYMGFTRAVDSYFQMLMHQVAELQAGRGGPVIAMQLEHEYGSFGENQQYLHFLRHTLRRYGATEAFYGAESVDGIARHRRLDGNFVGMHFNDVRDGQRLMSQLQAWDRNLPVFVSELWTGHQLAWGATDRNDVIQAEQLAALAGRLAGRPLLASFSAHMFHGGSNFGFAGAAGMAASHDWGAPVSEAGQVTDKYRLLAAALRGVSGGLKNVSSSAAADADAAAVKMLRVRPPRSPVAYGNVSIDSAIKWNTLVGLVENPRLYESAKLMEDIGQSFGFILYRCRFEAGQVVTIDGYVADRGLLLVNGEPIDPSKPSAGILNGNGQSQNQQQQHQHHQSHISLKRASLRTSDNRNVLDLLVENAGRSATAQFFQSTGHANAQRKGLCSWRAVNAEQLQTPGALLVNERPVSSYKIYSLQFDAAFVAKASVRTAAWVRHSTVTANCTAPGLYRATLTVPVQSGTSPPADTYLDMSAWVKGQAFINGFNLGRYWQLGPQRTLYVPGPLLKTGENEIMIFELHKPADFVTFVDSHKFVFPT